MTKTAHILGGEVKDGVKVLSRKGINIRLW